MAELRPQRFGRYLLIDKLGSGGMAEVYLAKTAGEAGFEKLLAIKRVLASLLEEGEFQTMFFDEAQISANLTHANIGQIFEFGEHNGDYFIAMEYVAGQDLRSVRQHHDRTDGAMPVAVALYTMSRVCQALDYAHRHKDADGQAMHIIHRDVSPPNVLVSYEGEIKLIDFGIAKAASRLTHTRAGKLKGKFSYMSPEQIDGREIDRRSDVFSAGVVLYEMLTNRRPFEGATHIETLKQVCAADPAPPSTLNPEVPLEVDRIVLRALAKDREQRYGWASELRADIERFFARTGDAVEADDVARWIQTEFSGALEKHRALLREVEGLRVEDFEERRSPSGRRSALREEDSAVTRAAGVDPRLFADSGESAEHPLCAPEELDEEALDEEPQDEEPLLAGALAELPATALETAPPAAGLAPTALGLGPPPKPSKPPQDDDALGGPTPVVPHPAPAAAVDSAEIEEVDGETDVQEMAGFDAEGGDPTPTVHGPGDSRERGQIVTLPTMASDALPSSEILAPFAGTSAGADAEEDAAGPTRIDAAPPGLRAGPATPEAFAATLPPPGAAPAAAPEALPAPEAGAPDGFENAPTTIGGGGGAVGGSFELAAEDLPPPRSDDLYDAMTQAGLQARGRESWSGTRVITRVKQVFGQLSSAQLIALAAAGTLVIVGVIVLLVVALSKDEPEAPVIPTGSLVIVTDPPAACSAAIDGRIKRLLSPGRMLKVSGLAPGAHEVTLTCAGFKVHAQQATVTAGKVVLVENKLEKE